MISAILRGDITFQSTNFQNNLARKVVAGEAKKTLTLFFRLGK
jgi:hypothetical protein